MTLFDTEKPLHRHYLTIEQAADLTGVTPCAIHEALCRGELAAVLDYRADLKDPRLLDRWELEYWHPTRASRGD